MKAHVKMLKGVFLGKSVDAEENAEYSFLGVSADVAARGTCALDLSDTKNWLALFCHNPYWIHPAFGENLGEVPSQTQFLLCEKTDGTHLLLLPILDGDLRATLVGRENTLHLEWNGAAPDAAIQDATLTLLVTGDDPFFLVKRGIEILSAYLKTFRVREEKLTPQFMQWLGWCTWDAFYHEVDERKVLAGLRSFQKGGISPGFVILDDGWLQTRGDYVQSFTPDATKFPRGLKSLVQRAKGKFGVREFGVWHAFQGYWTGVDKDSPLANEYSIVENVGDIRPWQSPSQPSDLALVHPRDVHRFYHDFYRTLQDAGVTLTKVDGQSALAMFSDGKLGRVGTMRSYQEALQGASSAHMKGAVVHCMCNSSDVAYHMMATNIWRNSDDYFPAKPANVQQKHVQMNVMNNLWTSQFAFPDWDMFQSHQAEAQYHAVSRSISGGPIYLCDKPNKQNFALIQKLHTSDGRVLLCERPALPTRDCLFVDTYKDAKLLKVSNHCGAIGVLGIFHCQDGGGAIDDRFSPRDIPELNEKSYAIFRHFSESLEVLRHKEYAQITLGNMESEIVTISPIRNGVAPLGLLDKFNGAAAITNWQSNETRTIVTLRDGGDIGFYCEEKPLRMRVNGRAARFSYDSSTRLLRINTALGREALVEVHRS